MERAGAGVCGRQPLPPGLLTSLGLRGQSRVAAGGLRSLVAPAALTASAHKTRTQTADLCYQAADIDNSQMVVTAVGGRAAC